MCIFFLFILMLNKCKQGITYVWVPFHLTSIVCLFFSFSFFVFVAMETVIISLIFYVYVTHRSCIGAFLFKNFDQTRTNSKSTALMHVTVVTILQIFFCCCCCYFLSKKCFCQLQSWWIISTKVWIYFIVENIGSVIVFIFYAYVYEIRFFSI